MADQFLVSQTAERHGVGGFGSGAGAAPGYSAGYGNGYQGGALLGESEINLVHYVQILYRRRYMSATALAVIVLAVALYTFTRTPVYEAGTRILIEKEDPNVVSFKEVLEQDKI